MVEERCRSGDLRGALEATLKHFGPEVNGFLARASGDETLAAEAFSQLCEDICYGLAGFEWASSLRTWVYVLARNALCRVRKREGRARRDLPLSLAEISSIEAHVRTATLPFLRTETRSAMDRLRDELDPADRELLILRVDRDLPWDEVARVTLGRMDADELTIKRESARLRQRFQSLKKALRQRARDEGLL
ncbi:MAG TPA: hypothetical protein VFS43_08605 [Polyangiaceae bacterium]|nr:hypothetical protein [Polyangiaceae bacterium]